MNCAQAAFAALSHYPSIAALAPIVDREWPAPLPVAVSAAATLGALLPIATVDADERDAIGVARLRESTVQYCAFRKGGRWWIATKRGTLRIKTSCVIVAWLPRELSEAH